MRTLVVQQAFPLLQTSLLPHSVFLSGMAIFDSPNQKPVALKMLPAFDLGKIKETDLEMGAFILGPGGFDNGTMHRYQIRLRLRYR